MHSTSSSKSIVYAYGINTNFVFSGYGPTETSVICILTDPLKSGDNGGNIGRSYTSRVWITDSKDHEKLTPIGGLGEIIIEGSNVGREYMGNPAKTKTAFIDPPVWAEKIQGGPVGRFYKTGDLGRLNSDGTITYFGRKDTQVKLRGQRIELHEVEHHISQSRSVKMAVAIVPNDGPLKDRLVALIMLRDDSRSWSSNEGLQLVDDPPTRFTAFEQMGVIRQSLEKSVPRHMVPTLWIPVITLPALTSGKIDRGIISRWLNALSQQEHSNLAQGFQEQATSQPTTETELVLQSLWSQLLNLPCAAISIDQSFFSFGGDSVLAMQMISLARGQGLIITAQQIFQHKTIAGVAQVCRQLDTTMPQTVSSQQYTEHVVSGVPVSPTAIEAFYPCSPMQESILDAQEAQPNLWFASFFFELASSSPSIPVSVSRFTEAWQKLVDRHQILRTIFAKDINGSHYQIVLKNFKASISHSRSESSDLRRAFNCNLDMPPASEPAHRLVLARTPCGKLLAQAQLSHALYDGVSSSILWHDLQVLYSDDQHDMPTVPYCNFISYLGATQRSKAIDFWYSRLTGAQSCHFPSLNITMNKAPATVEEIEVTFEEATKIQTFCRQQEVTSGSLFQAAWALVLRQFTNKEDVGFTYMVSGRDAPISDVESICGPLINLMPCRVHMPKDRELSSVVKELHLNLAEGLMVCHNQPRPRILPALTSHT